MSDQSNDPKKYEVRMHELLCSIDSILEKHDHLASGEMRNQLRDAVREHMTQLVLRIEEAWRNKALEILSDEWIEFSQARMDCVSAVIREEMLSNIEQWISQIRSKTIASILRDHNKKLRKRETKRR